ncbi:MAG: PilZ domain-containing protein [Bradyrhizobium sp.]|uniref:PilZ domain-containing protein n=1 Tax=Bradyrhizobium sp. TaxID=376 RepID=UPI003BAE6A62
MTEEKKVLDRVAFGRGHDVCIMAIDGTWRRDCLLQAVSDTDALFTVEGSIQGFNLKEFFLLLSSTGLAYRRCELVRVNGTDMDVQFLKTKGKKRNPVVPRTCHLFEVPAPQAANSTQELQIEKWH